MNFSFFVLFRRDGRLTHHTQHQQKKYISILKNEKYFFLFLGLCVMAQQSVKKYPPNKTKTSATVCDAT
jgi:hypothetical protein